MSDSGSSKVDEALGNRLIQPDGSENDSSETKVDDGVTEDCEAHSSKKRARGPEDCLNYESEDEEEFTPFTQEFLPSSEPEETCAKKSEQVFAKKSSVKYSGIGSKGSTTKKARVKSAKKSKGKRYSFVVL